MKPLRWTRTPPWLASRAAGVVVASAALGLTTAVLAPWLDDDEFVAAAMLFLLVVLLVSGIWGYVVGLFSALLADLLLNFFFIPPLHSVTVREPRNVIALVVFLAVAVVGASMLAMLRRQLAVAEAERRRATVLLDLSRTLAGAASPDEAMQRVCVAALHALGATGCAVLTSDGPTWSVVASAGETAPMSRETGALATTALESGQTVRTGASGASRQAAKATTGAVERGRTIVPLAATGVRGVLVVEGLTRSSEVNELVGGFADEAGLALQRATLARQARDVDVLREADQFKSTLLSSVSHDLRSPLTAVKAAVGSLRNRDLAFSDDDRESLLEIIESQTDRLTSVVSDLLEMSRIEGGAVVVRRESIRVDELFADALASSGAEATGRPIEVEAEGVAILGDRGLLLLALTNLLENACRYATAGTPVSLVATTRGHRVLLSVADRGPGIAADELPHIFEKFYRGSAGQSKPGTGLGLAIARALVEKSGGTLAVESAATGTTFTLNVPAANLPQQ